jgi:hypothetical protein
VSVVAPCDMHIQCACLFTAFPIMRWVSTSQLESNPSCDNFLLSASYLTSMHGDVTDMGHAVLRKVGVTVHRAYGSQCDSSRHGSSGMHTLM